MTKIIPTHDPSEEVFNQAPKIKAKQPKQKAPKAFKSIVAPSEPEKVQENQTLTAKYRYYCEFCSHNAFTSEIRTEGMLKTCQNCGKVIHTKITSYLPNQ